MTDKIADPVEPAKQPPPIMNTTDATAPPIVNSTDATRGEPLAMRAQKRKAELEQALEKLPAEDTRTRNDFDVALATINALLTGNLDRLSASTAAELSRILESSKHLGEVTPST
jgi:hypothetical protein